MTVVRTAFFEEAVWVRDDDGAEHRIAYADMPPGPYRQCGDCGCGKKGKGGNGNGGGKGHDGGTAHDGGNGPDEPTDPPIEGDSV